MGVCYIGVPVYYHSLLWYFKRQIPKYFQKISSIMIFARVLGVVPHERHDSGNCQNVHAVTCTSLENNVIDWTFWKYLGISCIKCYSFAAKGNNPTSLWDTTVYNCDKCWKYLPGTALTFPELILEITFELHSTDDISTKIWANKASDQPVFFNIYSFWPIEMPVAIGVRS